MVEVITHDHPLADYFVLYDKETMKPTLDPCFSEWLMQFKCGHEKVIFKDKYDMSDQFCANEHCMKMREVRSFTFKGVKPEDLDYDRPNEIRIHLKLWDVEKKSGVYYLKTPRILKNGKWIGRIDWLNAPNYGTFTEDQKKAEKEQYVDMAFASYSDQRSLAVFEVLPEVLNVPNIVSNLKLYLQVPDVKVYLMKKGRQRNDGTYELSFNKELKQEDLKIPELKTI